LIVHHGGFEPAERLKRRETRTHHVELVDELLDRSDSRSSGQRRIRRADPHTLPDPTTTT
jgi:hypothetical protein